MRRSLTRKLILVFLVVALTGVVLMAVFAGLTNATELNRLVLEQQRGQFLDDMTAYYEASGAWIGVADYVRQKYVAPQPAQPNPAAPANTQAGQPPPIKSPLFGLADEQGIVLAPVPPFRIGERLPAAVLDMGEPVEVDDIIVGTVLTTNRRPELDPREIAYLERTNRALIFSAVGAIIIALLLSIVLSRTVTRPLRELTTAAQAIAQGKLEQQVPVRSQDEVGELASTFNQMSSELARATQLRRQLTADIAHDLRTPLTVLAGYLESLRDGVLQPTGQRFDMMYAEVEHLQHLVEDLRTLYRVDAGELPLNTQPVSPLALLERAAVVYQHQAEQKQIALQVKAGDNLPDIEVDPARMAQVLGNLVGNALRYTPAHGQIILSARQETGQVRLAVKDNGEGIAPEDLPHIFARFYRADKSRRQEAGESGLGLAIAKSLVEAHGGTISAESRVGRGATFLITLPAI